MKNEKSIKKLEQSMAKIQSQIDELKNEPKFEVGQWYKGVTRKNIIAFCERADDNGFFGYGLDDNLTWQESEYSWLHNYDESLEATDKEVQEALIKEAKRRGFKDGVNTIGVGAIDSSSGEAIVGSGFHFYPDDSELRQGLKITVGIFKNGKWATIKEELI